MSGPFPPESIEKTDRLCSAWVLGANVRRALLKIELNEHRNGWGRPPTIYRLTRRPDKDYVTADRDRQLTSLLAYVTERRRGDFADALGIIADAAASTSESHRELKLQCGLGPDERVYGFALCCEAWVEAWVSSSDPDHIQRDQHQHGEHPNRMKMRMVWMAARDGFFWTLLRTRGGEPQIVVLAPESLDARVTGPGCNALGRLTAAVVNHPFPVPDLKPSEQAERGRPT